jgi:hypothetical protein
MGEFGLAGSAPAHRITEYSGEQLFLLSSRNGSVTAIL